MAFALIRRRAAHLLVAAAAFVSTARGQTPTPGSLTTVAVYAPACIGQPFDRSALGELLRVELRALGVTNVFVDSPDAVTTSLKAAPLAIAVVSPDSCDPNAREVTIRVVDRTIPKSLERRMVISDVAVAERSRALAIAIAELLAASFAELELAGAPQGLGVPPEVRAAIVARLVPAADAASRAAAHDLEARFAARDRQERAAAEERARRDQASSIDAAILARAFPARGTALLGGLVEARFRSTSPFAFHVGADLAVGDTDVPIGSVAVGAAAGRVGAAVTTEGSTQLEIGPVLEAGYSWAKGSTSDPNAQGQSYGNALVLALLNATVRVHGASSWDALVGFDVGYALASVRFEAPDGSRVAGLGGVGVGLRAGFGIPF